MNFIGTVLVTWEMEEMDDRNWFSRNSRSLNDESRDSLNQSSFESCTFIIIALDINLSI
jgi:hypothetical protein